MDRQIELRTHHCEGLAAYRARNWEEAHHAFAAALESVPNDAPSSTFIKRVDGLCAVAGRSRLRRGLIRAFVTERGAPANIPPKRNRKDPICFSPYLYRDRNLIERFFNKIKQCRRVATRYDKLAANYLAFVKRACIRLWLRVYECTA